MQPLEGVLYLCWSNLLDRYDISAGSPCDSVTHSAKLTPAYTCAQQLATPAAEEPGCCQTWRHCSSPLQQTSFGAEAGGL